MGPTVFTLPPPPTPLQPLQGVGESTTSAVVISLCCIFVADFLLSYLFFQGPGDALKNLM